MKCEWAKCPFPADYILLYICEHEHIGERVLCKEHLYDWEDSAFNHRAWCPQIPCTSPVSDWMNAPINQAAHYLRTR